mmetsp:Transcript_16821/g.45616  ORF Transcript_16821/g.45616 Transcript_16821/m.45616 type:complete len:229 (-) Transcript_16821:147-833(-)
MRSPVRAASDLRVRVPAAAGVSGHSHTRVLCSQPGPALEYIFATVRCMHTQLCSPNWNSQAKQVRLSNHGCLSTVARSAGTETREQRPRRGREHHHRAYRQYNSCRGRLTENAKRAWPSKPRAPHAIRAAMTFQRNATAFCGLRAVVRYGTIWAAEMYPIWKAMPHDARIHGTISRLCLETKRTSAWAASVGALSSLPTLSATRSARTIALALLATVVTVALVATPAA